MATWGSVLDEMESANPSSTLLRRSLKEWLNPASLASSLAFSNSAAVVRKRVYYRNPLSRSTRKIADTPTFFADLSLDIQPVHHEIAVPVIIVVVRFHQHGLSLQQRRRWQ